jgi:hypothetical protein
MVVGFLAKLCILAAMDGVTIDRALTPMLSSGMSRVSGDDRELAAADLHGGCLQPGNFMLLELSTP